MKSFKYILLAAFIFIAPTSRADMFGGDTYYLVQILSTSLRQLSELKSMVDNSEDHLNLMRNINRGVNDSLWLAKTINPNIDPGIYKDWQNVNEAIIKLQAIYGIVNPSTESKIYAATDRSVAEAVTLNNDIYKFTKNIDQLSETIKDYSHRVSPGGAQKLTAQSLGVMMQVMNQSLRAQATGLKLQAQSIAAQNKKEKDSTRQYLENANTLKSAMKQYSLNFKAPRF